MESAIHQYRSEGAIKVPVNVKIAVLRPQWSITSTFFCVIAISNEQPDLTSRTLGRDVSIRLLLHSNGNPAMETIMHDVCRAFLWLRISAEWHQGMVTARIISNGRLS